MGVNDFQENSNDETPEEIMMPCSTPEIVMDEEDDEDDTVEDDQILKSVIDGDFHSQD